MNADWVSADWPAPANIVAGTTTRRGGASTAEYASMNIAAHVGDDPDRVADNRRGFVAMCDLPGEPLWLSQVHGTKIIAAGALSPNSGIPEADAIVSGRGNDVCAVMTADCLPILLCTIDGTEVAAAHGGWRGIAGGIIEVTVAAMSVPAKNLIAWLGPAISQPAFEVGNEVRDAFVSHNVEAVGCFLANKRGRWQADLYGLARQRLAATGVTAVFGGAHCTYADDERFFSYRRDGQCGRMASFIFRRS